MPTTKVRGHSQIMDLSIDLGRLQVPFLSGGAGNNWDITNGNPDFTNGATITGVPDPIADQDVATKHYVDSIAAGLSWKEPATAATTANIDITNDLEAGDTIDGVTLAAGDRVLVKDQTNAANDEVQSLTASGATAGTFTMDIYISGYDTPFTTAAIAYNANQATIQSAVDTALATLPGYTNGDVAVTNAGTADLNATTLTFSGTSVDELNHPQVEVDNSGLTGGSHTPSTTTDGNEAGSENGVYVVQATGAAVRAEDWPAGDDAMNYAIFVSEGANHADDAFVVTNDSPNDIIDSNGLTFVQFAGAGTVATDVFNDNPTSTHGSPTVTLANTNIISNTERVYLNGVRQLRGASEDYQINYTTGVITFNFNLLNTPGQLDVVVVDYQIP